VFAETSTSNLAALDQLPEPSMAPFTSAASAAPAVVDPEVETDHMPVPEPRKAAGQAAYAEDSPKVRRTLPEPSTPGSRILDPGSSFLTGRQAPDAGTVSVKQLIGEYVAGCSERPPGSVLGHLGKVVKALLAEGIAAEHVRAGLARFAEIQGHPSRLPSLVNDAMQARAGLVRPGFRPNVPAHQAWTNPVDAVAAYAEEL
jgi:hypothetical protein